MLSIQQMRDAQFIGYVYITGNCIRVLETKQHFSSDRCIIDVLVPVVEAVKTISSLDYEIPFII